MDQADVYFQRVAAKCYGDDDWRLIIITNTKVNNPCCNTARYLIVNDQVVQAVVVQSCLMMYCIKKSHNKEQWKSYRENSREVDDLLSSLLHIADDRSSWTAMTVDRYISWCLNAPTAHTGLPFVHMWHQERNSF